MRQASHIFMTADAVGGVWTYALELAAAFSHHKMKTTLCVLGPSPSASQLAQAASIANLELLQSGLPLDWMIEELPLHREMANRLAEFVGRSGAQLLHLNSPTLAAHAGFGVPVVGVAHSCLATWWDAVEHAPLPEAFGRQTALLAKGYRQCDAVIAPTRSFAAATRAHYGIAVTTVCNGCSSLTGESEPREPVALTAGRLWDRGKNFAGLDEVADLAISPIEAAGPLAGPNGETFAPRTLQHLGQLDRAALDRRMRQVSVFAALPKYEPFGLSILEAAQAGCALVLSDIPTLRELWDGAAQFVPLSQPRLAAEAIDRLVFDDAVRREWAAKAQQRAANYTADAMMRGTLQVYSAVMAQSVRKERAA